MTALDELAEALIDRYHDDKGAIAERDRAIQLLEREATAQRESIALYKKMVENYETIRAQLDAQVADLQALIESDSGIIAGLREHGAELLAQNQRLVQHIQEARELIEKQQTLNDELVKQLGDKPELDVLPRPSTKPEPS